MRNARNSGIKRSPVRKFRSRKRASPSPMRSLLAGTIAVCGIGRRNGRRNSAVTANQSASPPTSAASATERTNNSHPLGFAEARALTFVESGSEVFLAPQCLVLPPFGIGVVLLGQERAGGLDRRLMGRRDVQFERDRPLRRHRLCRLGERLLVALPLPLDRRQ